MVVLVSTVRKVCGGQLHWLRTLDILRYTFATAVTSFEYSSWIEDAGNICGNLRGRNLHGQLRRIADGKTGGCRDDDGCQPNRSCIGVDDHNNVLRGNLGR